MTPSLDSLARGLRRIASPEAVLGAAPPDAFGRARRLVRTYYVALLAVALCLVRTADGLRLVPSFSLWPVAWAPWAGAWAGPMVQALFLSGALAAALLPASRGARLLAFLGCLEFGAYVNSFGKISHTFHLWVATSFLLILLPSAGKRGAERPYLLVVWYAQALALLTYSMAGLQKVFTALSQWMQGDRYWLLSPEALAIQVASTLLDSGKEGVLGSFLIARPMAGFPLMVLVLYLEIFAFKAAFHPSAHRPWGALLIAMHLGILAVMGLNFFPAMVLVAVLLCGSPFSTWQAGRRAAAWHWLPWIGPFVETSMTALGGMGKGGSGAAKAGKAGSTLVFFDGECGWCQKWILFLLRNGLPAHISFASLHGPRFSRLKARHPRLAARDSVLTYTKSEDGVRIRSRSEAVFWLYGQLPGAFRAAMLGLLIPAFLRDSGYRVAAALRHRVPQPGTCGLPEPQHRLRFMD